LLFAVYPPPFSVGLVLGCFFVSGFDLGLSRVLERLRKAGKGWFRLNLARIGGGHAAFVASLPVAVGTLSD
jgi:hypothetical protein